MLRASRFSEAGDVPAGAERRALVEAERVVEAPDDLGHPGEAVAQDPLDTALQCRRAHGTRAAGALELHLDDAGLDIGPHQHEIAAVGLHGRPHEVHDSLELLQAVGPLGVAELCRGLVHPSIVPCRRRCVTTR